MLRTTRKRTLAAAGGGWVQPYRINPWSPVLYANGGGDGGQGGDGGGSGKGGQGDGGSGGAGDGGSGDGDDKLGEGGKKALQAERDARATAEKRVAELEAKLTPKPTEKPRDKGGDKGDATPPDVEAIKKEIREEITADSNARLIKAEVKAAAAGKLADPSDAPRFIDLTKLKVGADGEVDAKAVKKAIDDLLKDKPYLAGKQPWGDVGGGGHETAPADIEPGMDRLRHAYATESKTK
jgi:hypothetical protein